MIFSALRSFLVVLLSESVNGPVSNVWNAVVLLSWFGSYEHFEIINTRIDDSHFVWYIFMYDHKYYNTHHLLKFCPRYFEVSRY